MLYLISSGKYIKVGYVEDELALSKRMKSYITHNPNFSLIGIANGDKNKEKYYHNFCGYKRINGSEFCEFNKEVVIRFLSEPSFKRINLQEATSMKPFLEENEKILNEINKLFDGRGLNDFIRKKRNKNEKYKIYKEVYEKIDLKIGEAYSSSYISSKLNEIYSDYGIDSAARVYDFWEYATTTKRENGKIVKAYRIIGYKFK